MKTVFMKSVICEYCNKSFKISGISRHRKACANKSTNQIAMSEQKHTPEECEPSPLGLPMRPILIRNDEMELLGASTPGPWKTDEEEYSQYVFGPDGEMICEMRGWGYLTGNRRKLSEKEAMEIQAANCKLIAQAPYLLAKVSEQQKEIALLNKHILEWQDKSSEQSQRIKALTKENKTLTHNIVLEMKANQEKERALTKENERLKKSEMYWVKLAQTGASMIDEVKDVEIKALTEQVEKLKADNVRLDMLTKDQETEIEHSDDEKDKYREIINRLREQKKELVEALREVLKTTLLMPELELKIESLLSKFEVPNT